MTAVAIDEGRSFAGPASSADCPGLPREDRLPVHTAGRDLARAKHPSICDLSGSAAGRTASEHAWSAREARLRDDGLATGPSGSRQAGEDATPDTGCVVVRHPQLPWPRDKAIGSTDLSVPVACDERDLVPPALNHLGTPGLAAYLTVNCLRRRPLDIRRQRSCNCLTSPRHRPQMGRGSTLRRWLRFWPGGR